MPENKLSFRDLRFIRKDAHISSLGFELGLNAITGASDTGKSYVLGTLNYMLGGQTPPSEIPEAKDYERVALEVANAPDFALERSLHSGGEFLLFEGEVLTAAEAEPVVLGARHGSNSGHNLSEFLLAKCGLTAKTIRVSASEKRELRWRDVASFLLVSETRIIDQSSPVHPTGQYASGPEEQSVFDFLISGRDSSSVVTIPRREAVKAGWESRRGLLQDQIARLEREVDELATAQTNMDSAGSVEADIARETERLNSSSRLLDESVLERAQITRSRQRIEGRLSAINQLVDRFVLLRQQYQSDIDRLRFVAEADYLLSQLGEPHCPTCGQLLAGHPPVAEEDVPSLQAAARIEIAKIELRISDLNQSIDATKADAISLSDEITAQGAKIERLNRAIEASLEPAVFATRAAVAALVARSEVNALWRAKRFELDEMQRQLNELGDKPPTQRRKESASDESLARREFCNEMAATLNAWRYPVGVVEFNSKQDLVIDGKPRRSFGKGLRAVIYAAFTVSLLRHSRRKGLPHPGFVVIDSPLTSYKGKDDYAATEDVQRAFFEDLSRERSDQIIVIENKEPPEDLQQGMRYVHFSGRPGMGRAGLFT